ncbi:hypothetical protein HGA92_04150 [Candidatus Gracilibacteria bacterium]|nr:hypothetical protein [Candidatus Gracilibacteria bacterium]NUJ98573.1 hypothetical protein [Candidatus Gracilibacteria bacterium]
MFENEKIVETKICRHCNGSFDITDKDLEFYEKVSPIFQRPVSLKETGLNGEKSPDSKKESELKKYLIPPPTLCPDCRQQRRLSFRNERKLYKRKCDFSGKDIISIYSPDKPYKVYNMDFWLSDKWSGVDYAKDFDFSRSAFEQFDELLKEVPRIPFFQSQNENSEYTNGAQKNKNSYMIFVSDYNENCFYGNGIMYSKNVVDSLGVNKSENCYECIDSDNCYNCYYSQDLVNCHDCYNCKGLIGKSYHIKNKEYPKEQYFKEIEKIFSKEKIKQDKVLYYHGFGIEKSTGDFIKQSKKSTNCFDAEGIEYCKNIVYGFGIKDCYDSYVIVDDSQKCYETISGINCYNTLFAYTSWYNSHSYYIDTCQTSKNLFLCAGLKNKSYCILNKQYTKEEYEKIVPKIIEHMMKTGEWGEFFPSSLSPFGYNETVAQEYYPINTPPIPHPFPQKEKGNNSCLFSFSLGGKDAGKADRGTFNWSTYEAPFPKVEKIIPASKLPENIADIPDDILNWAIECEVTKKPFRIIKEELAFYRKHNLPIPRRHPDQRHLDRMSLRNPRHLYTRNCDKCGKEIQTTYAPERPEIVYCEECYNKEMY